MLLHIFDLDLGYLGVDVRNAGISYNDVKMVDAVGYELLHSLGRIGRDGGVDLDGEKRGAFRLRQVSESFRCCMIGVAVGGNDRVVRFGEIELEETLANASIGAGDQHDDWCHDELGS